MLSRATIFIYGIFRHLVFFATSLYALGFVGDLYVPKSEEWDLIRFYTATRTARACR